MKVLPVFYPGTATVEKARDFWELFEAHTEGLLDRSKLLVFRLRLKGREAERWGNSSIRTFSSLKVQFHYQSLSRTADELVLMFKDTHRPIEEDDEFSDEAPSKKGRDTPVLASVDALAQHMKISCSSSNNWRRINGVHLGPFVAMIV
ncbi:hypothetical protein PInf_023391 [Phytophthora infestans]|nr:hypothetical protein PInf_023391 [Phytophthora infestans]